MWILETKLRASDLCRNLLNPLSHSERFILFWRFVFVFLMYVCMHVRLEVCVHVSTGAPRGQKRASDFLVLQETVTCSCEQTDVGIKMWILYRNSPCSDPQCNLFSSPESYLRPVLPVETQCDPYNAILNDFMSRTKKKWRETKLKVLLIKQPA